MTFLLKIFGFALIVILITAIDVSFLPALGSLFNPLNLGLSIALYFMVIVNRRYSLLLLVFTSVLAGLTASAMLFTPIIIGVFVLLMVDWLFESFFTNRSYYTLLALGIVGWFTYYILFAIFVWILSIVSSTAVLPVITFSYVSQVLFGAIFLLLILSGAYAFTTFFSKKFKSYFILSD